MIFFTLPLLAIDSALSWAKRLSGFFLKAIRKLIGEFFGYHSFELTLKDNEWEFFYFTTIHDRDINVAINIKKFYLIDQNLIGI
jgi:hypothetical protein